MPSNRAPLVSRTGSWQTASLLVLVGAALESLHLQSLLDDSTLATNLISAGLWRQIVERLGSRVFEGPSPTADVGFLPLFLLLDVISLLAWTGGAWWISRRRQIRFQDALTRWGLCGWLWWLLPGVWELLRLAAFVFSSETLNALLASTPAMWQAVTWSGWIATGIRLAARAEDPQSDGAGSLSPAAARVPAAVWWAMGAYVVCFSTMNALLYKSLLVPHGDSAMYEEHLWNLLHGKGFRSYLDNGRLFLGEHVQVIHLLLIPLYVLWPSHLLLEFCQSLALASGAVPVYWIALRHGGSTRAACLLAAAYLLYFPMQFLDIAVDFKTFRPNAFEIPLLLFALDALERCRYRRFALFLVFTLLAQEDAAPVLAPLGVWIALRQPGWHTRSGHLEKPAATVPAGPPPKVGGAPAPDARGVPETPASQLVKRRIRCFGAGLAAFSTVYVLLVVRVILPWFRGGHDVHFASYFSRFGGSSGEIARNLLSHPRLLLCELLRPDLAIYALGMLLPLAFLPLLSPGRLAVAAPLFGVLCLNEIARTPLHHFHAPLVPIVVWAAAAGLGQAAPVWGRVCRWWDPDKETAGRAPVATAARKVPTGKRLAAVPANPAAAPAAAIAAPPPVRRVPAATLFAATWCLTSSAAIGFFIGLSPLGINFWDPHSLAYWRALYVPGPRAAHFRAVLELVPPTSRVASTDFVHPRFTHFERSYDYSDYRPNVPDDADYIVIDTQHP